MDLIHSSVHSTTRCSAAHPEDRTPCSGPLDAVTVLDAGNRGTTGCEHHAARLLASLKGGRVYSGSVDGAAIRVFEAAADLRPFAWQGRSDTPPAGPEGDFVTRIQVVDSPERVQVALARLATVFTSVTVTAERPSGCGVIEVDLTVQF